MKDLQIFNNPEFGQIRAIQKDGEPWFVGKDVAEVLGYSNTNKAILDHVDVEDTSNEIIGESQNGKQFSELTNYQNGIKVKLINESGLYSLILSSKLPTAKKFKRWVTSEVLPSIRKTGAYINPTISKPKPRCLKDVIELAEMTRELMEAQECPPSDIAKAVEEVCGQYNVILPPFIVKSETDTRLNDLLLMADFVFTVPRGRGHKKPTYTDYCVWRTEQYMKEHNHVFLPEGNKP